jgi:hypothetical protein
MGANTNAPHGFEALELGFKYRSHLYRITNNYGTALYLGDPVAVVTAGTIERATAGSSGVILGSIVGIYQQHGPKTTRPENLLPISGATGAPYLAATLGTTYDYWALVADEVDQIFLVQEDSDTTPLQYTSVGANADHVAGTGSTVTGFSGAMIDSSSGNSTATLQWRLIQPAPIWDAIAGQWNTVYDGVTASAYTKWIVRCNMHQLAARTAGLA